MHFLSVPKNFLSKKLAGDLLLNYSLKFTLHFAFSTSESSKKDTVIVTSPSYFAKRECDEQIGD